MLNRGTLNNTAVILWQCVIYAYWPLVANKVNGRICISLQEHEGNRVSCTVLPGKWSHGDHKTWLFCSKTIRKARSRHRQLLRAAERERQKAGESLAASFAPTATLGSQAGAMAAWEIAELKWGSYMSGPQGWLSHHIGDGEGRKLCPCLDAFSSLPVVGLQTTNVHFYPLSSSLEPETACWFYLTNGLLSSDHIYFLYYFNHSLNLPEASIQSDEDQWKFIPSFWVTCLCYTDKCASVGN